MPLRVFISYSTKDLEAASAIWKRLQSEGHPAYFAEHSAEPGTKLSVELERKIKECDVFVLLWSSNAKDSEWVSQEIGIAQGAAREILPVMLEAHLQSPGFVRDRKYLPAHEGMQKALEHLTGVIRKYALVKMSKEAKEKNKEELVLLGLGVLILLALSSD